MVIKWKAAIGLTLSIAFCVIAIGNVSGYTYGIDGKDYDAQAIYGDANDNIEIQLVSSDESINLYIMTFTGYLDYESISDSTYDYTIDAGDDDYQGFYGDKNDIYDIELISSSGEISLFIADEYLNISGNADIDWSAEDVTSGQWTWTQPNDETWYLVLINEGSTDIDASIIVRINVDSEVSWSQIGVTGGTWDWNMETDDSWYLVIENPTDTKTNVELVISGGSFLNEGEDACDSMLIAGILILAAVVFISSFVIKRKEK